MSKRNRSGYQVREIAPKAGTKERKRIAAELLALGGVSIGPDQKGITLGENAFSLIAKDAARFGMSSEDLLEMVLTDITRDLMAARKGKAPNSSQ